MKTDSTNPLFLYATSFLAGYIMLSLEVLGYRMLAPYFGYSVYVFGALIGVILLALSFGYMLGGYWGDYKLPQRSFFFFWLLGALWLGLVSISRNTVMTLFLSVPVISGALTSTLFLLGPPMIVLAALSPYLTTILTANGQKSVGFSSGAIYAISTLGSLAGTFFTSFYLLPTIGLNAALFLNIILMITIALLWIKKPKLLMIAIPLLILLAFIGKNATSQHSPVALDSTFSYLEIRDYGRFLGLSKDRRTNLAHSTYPKGGKWLFDISMLYNLFGVAPLINDAKSVLLLGFGAGSIARIHQDVNPDVEITGVEIDPGVISLGRQYLGLDQLTNIKRLVIDDVRPFVAREQERYDLIEIDLFNPSGDIPFYLATKEFFELTRGRLNPHGVLAMNVYDPSPQKIVISPIARTLLAAYPFVSSINAYSGSYFLLASFSEIKPQDPKTKIPPELADTFSFFNKNLRVVPLSEGLILTDDRSPLDILGYKAVFGAR